MQELFVQLFNKNLTDPGTENLLMPITEEYPYFTVPHFFLLKKTKNTDPAFEKLAAKTALHFNNPFLLNFRLKEVEERKVEVEREKVEERKVEVEREKVEERKVEAEEVRVEQNKDEVKGEEMIFEPLFASDYFASQGIKLSEDIQSGDKLGKQLKSFTEWLKGMKKIHENKESSVSEQIDITVQHLAEKSNLDANIITESMAEAYLQQGKMKKARETFEKLSLLNPAKSAYFAAKIESIAQDH